MGWIQETTTYGPIMGAFGVDEVKRNVEAEGSHFFTPDTMRWFGTRNLAMIDGLVMVGLDTKAPEDRYWARVFRTDGGAEMVGRRPTRDAVIRLAHETARQLKAEGQSH